MKVRGVLLDFSGTVFALQPLEAYVAAAAASIGLSLPGPELSALTAAYAASGGVPGGPLPAELPHHLREDFLTRDLDPVRHRRAYLGLLSRVEGPRELAPAVYERHTAVDAWQPGVASLAALELLAARQIPVALVSNIAHDVRPTLDRYGMGHLFRAVLLSFEQGRMKPDPELFMAACRALDVDPADALMVGDDPAGDGGAARTGIRSLVLPKIGPGEDAGLADLLDALTR